MKLLNCIKKSALLLVIALIGTTAAFAQTAQTINPDGGFGLTDGLKFVVNTNGALSVYRDNRTQYYITPTASNVYPDGSGNGVTLSFRFDDGTYLSTTKGVWQACSTTAATDDGVGNWTCSISGYVSSPVSNKLFYVTLNISYTYPNKYFAVDYFVRAPTGLTTPETVHLYLSHDAYILGYDASRGYRNSNATGEIIGDYRAEDDNTTKCGTSSQRNACYPSHHGFKIANPGFRSYFTGAYSLGQRDATTIDAANLKITGTSNLTNPSCFDDAVAVEFTIGPLAAGQVGATRVLHCYGDVKGEFDDTPVGTPYFTPGLNTPVTVDFAASTFSEQEGNADHAAGNIQIRVGGGRIFQDQVCNFSLSNGTATNNIHYSYVKGFIIPADDYTTPKTFTLNNVTIIGNTDCNVNRTFDISIDNPGDCNDLIVRGTTQPTATITIVDDDSLHAGTVGPPQTVCTGTAPTSPLGTVTAPTGGGGPTTYTYLWQSSTNGGTTWVAASGSNTGADYTPGVLTQTTQYRRQVVCCSCPAVYSDPVTVTVKPCYIPVNPHIRGNIK